MAPEALGKENFLFQALLHSVRGCGDIAVACSWNGLAASLLPGGRTCHARFGFPVPIPREHVSWRMKARTGKGQVLIRASILLWDEVVVSAPAGALDAACRYLPSRSVPMRRATDLWFFFWDVVLLDSSPFSFSPSNGGALFLPAPVFAHGQLYFVLSRVHANSDICVLLQEQEHLHGPLFAADGSRNGAFTQFSTF